MQSRPDETDNKNKDTISPVWSGWLVQLRVLHASARAGDSDHRLPRLMRHLFQLALAACVLSCGWLKGAEPDPKPVTLSGPDALERTVQTLAGDLTNQLQAADQRAQKVAASGDGLGVSIYTAAGVVAGILILSRLLPLLAGHFTRHHDPWAPVPIAGDVNTHEKAFSRFVEQFDARHGTLAPEEPSRPTPGVKPLAWQPEPRPAPKRPKETRGTSLDQVTRVRRLFSRLSRASNQGSRQQGMANLLEAVRLLREDLEAPAAHSAKLLASALEALLGEVADKEERATPSVLRTIAGAIDLLPGLCAPGVRPDLTSHPVVRLLGVDDDAISRYTLTCALKRHFPQPDLAVNGEDALRLAETRSYDLIFVDIEMPGMDGFELCSRLHSTSLNQATPVVFVTGHNDLGSRAKSSVAGGVEFLGKPFLGFELTVKALSLVLKRRLQAAHAPVARQVAPPKQAAVKA